MKLQRRFAAALVFFPAALLSGCCCPSAHGGSHRGMRGTGEGMCGPPHGMHLGPPMAMHQGPPPGMQGPPPGMHQGPPPGMQGPPPGVQQGPPPDMKGRKAGPRKPQAKKSAHRPARRSGEPGRVDLARVMERLERIENALHQKQGPGREGGPGMAPPEEVRREMQEMRAGMERREERIRELQQQVEKMEGAMRRMKEERPDPPAKREEKR